jgi:membrane dipeptidase
MIKRVALFALLPLSFSFLFSCAAHKTAKLHKEAIVVDTHNDFISKAVEKGFVFDANNLGKTHSDLARMKKGGLDVQIFSIWCDARPDAYAFANREIDSLYAYVARNPSRMKLVTNGAELDEAIKNKQLASMIGVEGGHMIEEDLSKLEALAKRGARYMTLTWNNSTSWASSAADEYNNKIPEDKRGLTDFGVQVIEKMNELGVMVDLSHVGEKTFLDAIATTTKPVIVSHSCVHALCPVARNLKDYQISAIKLNKGVICLNFFSGFLDSSFNRKNTTFMAKRKAEADSMRNAGLQQFFIEDHLYEKYKSETEALRVPMNVLLDHIDYIVKRIGVDHVGLGSDFDGINSAPQQLNGVQDFPKITAALKKRGYSNEDIKKILGGNVIRVFKANLN